MTQSNTHNAAVLVISSQVIDGQVGIQAIAPGLRAFGLGCIGLPTTLLAAHPAAYPQAGPPAGGALPAKHITEFADWLMSAGAFEELAGVLTGYMPSVEHVEATADAIDLLRAQKPDLPVCCDPICGDNERLYLPREVAAALGEHLLPRAGIATPNLFELGHLTGTGPLEQTQDAARAAQEALGWDVAASTDGDRVLIAITGPDGAPVAPPEMSLITSAPASMAAAATLALVVSTDSRIVFAHA